MPIVVTSATPGAAEGAKSMHDLADAVRDASKAADEAKRGTAEYDAAIQGLREANKAAEKAEREHALAVGGTKAALLDAASAYAAVTGAVVGFAAAAAAAGAKALQLAAGHDQEMRAINALGPAYAGVQAATNGVIGAQQALHVQQALVQSGLRVSKDELEAITRKARDYALATGTDASQALDQLTDALKNGEAEGLRRFGIGIDATKGRVENFHAATKGLIGAQKDQAVEQRTLNEELSKSGELFSSMLGIIGNSVTAAFGLRDVLHSINGEMQEIVDLERQAEKDSAKMRLQDSRLKLNLQIDAMRRGGVGDDVLGTIDTTHMNADQVAKYLQLTQEIKTGGSETATMRAMLMGAAGRGQIGGSVEGFETAMRAAVIKARMSQMGITNESIAQDDASAGSDFSDIVNGTTTAGPAAGHELDKPGAGGTKGPDQAAITEQLRAITRMRALRGLQMGLENFTRSADETAQHYVERMGAALEEQFVTMDERVVQKRGESDFDFAKRRLDLARSTLDKIAEAEQAHREQVQAANEAAVDAMISKARADAKFVDDLFTRVGAHEKELREKADGTGYLDQLKNGTTSVEALKARLSGGGSLDGLKSHAGGIKDELADAQAAGDDEKIARLKDEAKAIADAISAYHDLAAAQHEANDASKQFASAFIKATDATASGASKMADFTAGAFSKAANAFGSHIEAAIEGKEKLGDALRAATHETLSSLAQEAAGRFLMALGAAAVDIATPGLEPFAAGQLAAAGFFGGVMALGGLGAALTAPPSSAATNAAASGSSRVPSTGTGSGAGGGDTHVVFNFTYSGTQFDTAADVHRGVMRTVGEAFRTQPMHPAVSRAMRRELVDA